MGIIFIYWALFLAPPAALICFLINLLQYTTARKKQENAKKRTWIIPLAIFLASSLCMIIAAISLFIEFGNDMAHM